MRDGEELILRIPSDSLVCQERNERFLLHAWRVFTRHTPRTENFEHLAIHFSSSLIKNSPPNSNATPASGFCFVHHGSTFLQPNNSVDVRDFFFLFPAK